MSAQSPNYQPQFSLWVRQLLTVLLIIVGLYLLILIAPVLPMLTVAFLIAFVMFIPSRALARRTPIPYAISVIMLYMLLIIVMVLGMLLVIPSLLAGINSLIASLLQGYNDFVVSLQALRPQDAVINILGISINLSDPVRTAQSVLLNGTLPRTTGFLVPPTVQTTTSGSAQQVALGSILNQILPLFGSVSQTVTSAITGITGVIGSFLLALFVSFLVLLDIPVTQNMLSRQIPVAYHREFALLVNRIVHVWNGFFRGQVLIGFAIGVLTFIQLSWMGISNTFILAVIVGTISLIPTIGGIIALIPLSLIPLITGSQTFPEVPHGILALLVVGINLVISQIIWNLIAPKILGDALDLPLPVIIVGVFVGAAAAGVLGAFLAAPVLATLRVIVSYVWHKINQEDPFPNEEAPFEWGTNTFSYQGRLRPAIRIPVIPAISGRNARSTRSESGRNPFRPS
ncbi:MAG TPA: AI-2E family transporter [Phototrophicaceae bacterium]|nr:AI-2E family transporter [Phototrophicaceae bacterium]